MAPSANWRRFLPRGSTAHVLLLLLIAGTKGLFWVGLIPYFLVADEPAHFDNVQFRAEQHAAPIRTDSKPIPKVMHGGAAREVLLLWRESLPKTYYAVDHNDTKLPDRLTEMATDPNNRFTDGQAPAMDYPGLFYELAVPFYNHYRVSSVLTRIAAVRMLSWMFGLMAVIATYFAARLVVSDAMMALVIALLVALQPMASQQTAAVNNDAGVIGFSALLFYFQLRTLATLPKMPSIATLAGLVVSSVLLAITKPTGYGILPGTAAVLVIGAIALRKERWVQVASAIGAVAGIVVIAYGLSSGTFERNLPGDTTAIVGPYGRDSFLGFLHSLDNQYLDYLLRSAWGQFGWLDYSMSFTWIPQLRSVFVLMEVGTIVAIAAHQLRDPERPYWQRGDLLGFSIATVLVGVVYILYVEHRYRLTGVYGVIQGRNFLFVVPAFSIWLVVSICATVPARMRALSTAIILSGALCLHATSLMTIIRQHYVH